MHIYIYICIHRIDRIFWCRGTRLAGVTCCLSVRCLTAPRFVTHSYVTWHDSFICVTWRHAYVWHDLCMSVAWLTVIACCLCVRCLTASRFVTHAYAWHDLFIRVTWLIRMCGVTQHICVTWLIHVCDMTHECSVILSRDVEFKYAVLYRLEICDSFVCDMTRLIHTCDITHSYDWYDVMHMCGVLPLQSSWLNDTCDMRKFYVWQDSSICGDRLEVRYSFICVTWLIRMCGVTHLYVWYRYIYVWQDSSMCGA